MSEDKTNNGGKGKPDNSTSSDSPANRAKPASSPAADAPSGADAPSKPSADNRQTAATKASASSGDQPAGQNAKPAQGGPRQQPKDKNVKGSQGSASSSASAGQSAVGKKTPAAPASSSANTASSKSRASDSGPAASSSQKPARSASASSGAGQGSGNGPSRAASGGGQGEGKSGAIGLVIAVVALVIALLAAAGAGWLWYRSQSTAAELSSRVNTVEKGMQANVQKVVMPRLSDMKEHIQSLSSNVSGLSDRLDQRQKQVKQLQSQIRHVQTQNTQLADRLDGTHQRFIEQRIEALLVAANQRLRLYNDPVTAQQALKLADQAIQQAGDPRLYPVRRDIADEIAALKALPNPDVEGLSLKLSNLVKQVPTLPLATNVPSEYHNSQSNKGNAGDAKTDASSNALSSIDVSRGWHHFVDSLGGALSSMVTVRRANGTQNAPALMAPDQAYFLTQNLQLQLRSAQLELLSRDTQAYQDSLSSAHDWIKQYFDNDASSVKAVLDTFNELSNVKLDWQAPDISASLSTLRSLMADQHNTESQADSGASDQQASSGSDNGGSEQ